MPPQADSPPSSKLDALENLSPPTIMTESEIERWKAYRDELQAFILVPENGIWLEAEKYLDPSGKLHHIPGAAFHLTSGRYRREFISMWELFDHPAEFDRCIDMLVERAVLIYKREQSFNTIVTCTHTAREIVRHLRPKLEMLLGREIEVSEFGHYPHDSPDGLEIHAFRSRSVLIFTDVMASGKLVRDMALRVGRTGGDVVGVLTMVLCDSEVTVRLDDQGISIEDLNLGIEGLRDKVCLHALTSIKINELTEQDFDPTKLRRIDFVSVFPEAPANLESPEQDSDLRQARFTREEMMIHFAETNALIHGHFASDNRHFTHGVRIGRLLQCSKVADEIWERIKTDCLGKVAPVLICTFKKNDLLLTRFVQQRMKSEDVEVPFYVMKRELGDFPHLHQALYPHTHQVVGKSVILLRATATTSEELRSIAALLAAENVKSITVICLVNRMGRYTISFVRRVRELVTNHPGTAGFEFVQVYHLTDLRTDDLIEMQRRADSVLDRYIRVTEIPYFKFLAEDFRRALDPVSADTAEFESQKESETARILADIAHEMVEHRTDKLMALIQRDEGKLTVRLEDVKEEEIYLNLTRLIIADVDYIRLSKKLRNITNALHARLRQLRQDRFKREEEFWAVNSDGIEWPKFEGDPTYHVIMQSLKVETQLIFSLALLSHFDKNDLTEEEIIRETLFGNCELDVWRAHPLNLRYHFREPTLYWLTSFMIHAIHPDFFTQTDNATLRLEVAHVLREWFESMLSKIPTKAHDLDEKAATLLEGQIRDMKNHLLMQLGSHARGLWHQRIRFLHHHLLHRSEGHSPIWTALKSLETDFEDLLTKPMSPELMLRTPRHAQEALNAAITLREISESIHHLAGYPNHEVSEALKAQFANPNSRESFEQATVAPLLEWVKVHQQAIPDDDDELDEYKNLIWKVKQSIFDSSCAVRKALSLFCVPLEQVLMDAMSSVNARIVAEGYEPVWTHELERLRIGKGTQSHLVLCEPHLLLEVLRNLLSNVRYAVEDTKKDHLLSQQVKLKIGVKSDKLPDPEGGDHDYVFMVVETEGLSYSERTANRQQEGGTFRSHQARILEFGGNLTIGDGVGGQGSHAELRLISRMNYNGIFESLTLNIPT